MNFSEIYRSLSREEVKILGRYLEDYFPAIDPLAIKMHKLFVQWNQKEIPYETGKFVKTLYGRKAPNSGHVRVARSHLKKVIEEFLVKRRLFESKRFYMKALLFEELLNRRCLDTADSMFHAWIQLDDRQRDGGGDRLESDMMLGTLSAHYYSLKTHHERNMSEVLKLSHLHRNEWLQFQILKQAAEGIAMKKIYGHDYGLTNYVSDSLLNSIDANSPILLQIYKMCYLSYEHHPEGEFAVEMFEKYKACSSDMDELTSMEILTHVENRMIQLYNAGDREMGNQIMKLYQYRMDNDFITHRNAISPVEYHNIISIAIEQKELDWAEHFAREYYTFLPVNIANDFFQVMMASIAFSRGHYQKTLDLLKESKMDYGHYGVFRRNLVIRSLYKLQEMDALLSMIESFEKYLIRVKDIGENFRTRNQISIRFLHRLAVLKPLDRIGLKKLRKEVTGTSCNFKSWLLNEIEFLCQKRGVTD